MKHIVLIIAFGLVVILSGFVYDVFFAGIPYQDPTPALVATYNYHSQIASIIRWSGTGICFFGVIAAIIHRLKARG
jgi:hypothetical protein